MDKSKSSRRGSKNKTKQRLASSSKSQDWAQDLPMTNAAKRHIQREMSLSKTTSISLANGDQETKISFGPSRPPVETMPSMAEASAISQSNISKLTSSSGDATGIPAFMAGIGAMGGNSPNFIAGSGTSKIKKKKGLSTATASGASPGRNGKNVNPFGLPSSAPADVINTANINPFVAANTNGTSISFGSLDLEALREGVALATGAVKSAAAEDPSGLPCSEAEMKALMSMFVEIMGMSAVEASNAAMAAAETTRDKKNGKSKKPSIASDPLGNGKDAKGSVFMFGSSGNGNGSEAANVIAANAAGLASAAASLLPNGLASIPPPPGGWTEGAIDQMAAATAGFFTDSTSWEAIKRTYGGLAASSNFAQSSDEDIDDDDDDICDDSSLPELDDMRDIVRGQQKAAAVAAAAALTSNYRLSPMEQAAAASALASAATSSPTVSGKFPGNTSLINGDIEWDSWEQIAIEDALEAQERSRKAAKKREKKQRKKTKAKEEAAQKAAQAAQKKREKAILSWRSRVVSACQSNEVTKLEALLQESPLFRHKPNETGNKSSGAADDDVDSVNNHHSVILPHLEFLLPNSVAKNRSHLERGKESRHCLAGFILELHVPIAFTPLRTGRSALHTACFHGDVSFVRQVIEKVSHYQDTKLLMPEPYLDITCSDSGWSPLHYAVVSGSNAVLETLLANGCDVSTITDDTHTWRESDGNGITARELAEYVYAGTYEKDIESHGVALQEMANFFFSNQTDRKSFLKTVELAMKRLDVVRSNGYAPQGLQSTDRHAPANTAGNNPQERSTSRNRKKKKKKKGQIQQQAASEAVSVSASTSTAQSSLVAGQLPKDDPTVIALLGMGFADEQIRDAAKACGGINRATADDLIAWIFGQDAPQESAIEDREIISALPRQGADLGAEKEETEISMVFQPKNDAAADATRQDEAAKEKKAVAARLAIKREEARRRNREWNNREQARQQEEAKAKMAKALAPSRIAARAPVSQAVVAGFKTGSYQHSGLPNAAPRGQFRSGTGLANNSVARPTVTPRQILTHPRNINSGIVPDAVPPPLLGERPSVKQSAAIRSAPSSVHVSQLPLPVQTTTKNAHPGNMRGPPVRITMPMDDDRTVSSLGSSRSRTHSVSSMSAPPSAAPPGFRHNNVPNGGTVIPPAMMSPPLPPHVPSSSNMTLPHMTSVPIHPSILSSTNIPSIQQPKVMPQNPRASFVAQEGASSARSNQNNPLGEIRATAKAFVPSSFALSGAAKGPPNHVLTPPPSNTSGPFDTSSTHSRESPPFYHSRQSAGGGALGIAVQNSIQASSASSPHIGKRTDYPNGHPSSESTLGKGSLLPALSGSLNYSTEAPVSNDLIPLSTGENNLVGEGVPIVSSLGFAFETSHLEPEESALGSSSLLESLTGGPTIGGSSIWETSGEGANISSLITALPSVPFANASRESTTGDSDRPHISTVTDGVSGYEQSWALNNNATSSTNTRSGQGSIW